MTEEDMIKDVVNVLKSIREVEAIYLFGSRARGNITPLSDIDICVITRRHISKDIKEEILSNSSRKIDISIFWDLPPTIRFRVLKEGMLLYNKNKSLLHQIKVDTSRQYMDISPMIERHCSRILRIEK